MAIVVDANVFLRAFTEPTNTSLKWMQEEARHLFLDANAGELELTTTDAVVAEVAFVLTAKSHYQLSPQDACARLLSILQIRNLRFPTKPQTLRALDIWTQHPKLGFVDALVAAHAEAADNVLATFDQDYTRVGDVSLHQWERPSNKT